MNAKITDRLATKLSRIRSGEYEPADFIIADAKDADMGGGISGVGFYSDKNGNQKARTALDYQTSMREMVESGLVDIMLTSIWSAEQLKARNVFDSSDVTPAVRLNDATDIWGLRGARYRAHPAAPFRTARLEQARKLSPLGLYAVTFYNDRDLDVATLNAYRNFREQAQEVGMHHFLEVFNPAFEINTFDVDLGTFINDAIVRCLAGVAGSERPLFLKMQYNGARAMEELSSFDPENLIVGVLGGAAGTTRDTFELVAQTQRFGGRVALFGRKIYNAEDSIELVKLMRMIIEGKLGTVDAVKMYHEILASKNIDPVRALVDDLVISDSILEPEAE